ncbi:ABC transporter permease [Acinetobacter rathckeae]|uniref:ABC transporter permease n=1 Tax=Acinetobacter rathckeae TaxID=2605272 RepID=UPI0018A29955|nr:ABC transporter permease [Acinetobacter rathckeae]MBF7687221.1 ABC transporter permease [Acinetobacter rathckeae]MBF7694426.1 ABC transporter permease [Acinetobacter rathckeae]
MSTSNPSLKDTSTAQASSPSNSLWALAWKRLKKDKTAMISFAVVLAYFVMLILSMTGIIAKNWDKEVAVSYAPPTFVSYFVKTPETSNALPVQDTLLSKANVPSYGIEDPLAQDMQEIRKTVQAHPIDDKTQLASTLAFGADRWGVDIISKTIKGSETSILVGIIAALFSVILGTILGAVSGYFGGWIDDIMNWFYNVFTSIPYMLLILAIAAVLQKQGLMSIIIILALTGWTGTYRLIRAEYMKHTHREYVLAAKAIGVSHFRRMFVHIFPNVSHIALVQMSILVVGFIKSEVILSFLGFGVPVGTASWGSMLSEAQSEFLLGKWWQLVAATTAMAILVTAFSLFTDALRDALDPKLK